MSGKCFSCIRLTVPNCSFRKMAQLSMSIRLLGRAQFPPNGCTSDTLLLRCVRHSRHHIPPHQSLRLITARCQHRSLIRSVHNRIALCLSSSLTRLFRQLLSHSPRNGNTQFLHRPVCHSSPCSASSYQTQLLGQGEGHTTPTQLINH